MRSDDPHGVLEDILENIARGKRFLIGVDEPVVGFISLVRRDFKVEPVDLMKFGSTCGALNRLLRARTLPPLPLATLVFLITVQGLGSTPLRAQEAAVDQLAVPHQDASGFPPKPSTWKGAIADSFRLLMIEHTTRVAFQPKTRRELGGPFFSDYIRSVKIPDSWEDGDSWGVNYIGHPIHGAAAGFVWLDHEDGSHDPRLGFSREYWASRSRALAWAAAYSVQFEFGPLSEASIGNVGLRSGTTGWVDHVVTPAGALGFMVAEDALDRYLVTRIESWTSNRVLRAMSRLVLNPSRTLSNAAQGRTPWFRAARPLR